MMSQLILLEDIAHNFFFPALLAGFTFSK